MQTIEKGQRVWHKKLGKGEVLRTPSTYSNLAEVQWDENKTSNLVSKESLYPVWATKT